MAGAILISENSTISLGSIEFFYIIDTIKKFFKEEDLIFMKEIYSTVEEAGMYAISLLDENTDCFKAFFSATMLAYESEVNIGASSAHLTTWKKLIDALSVDERCLH